MATTLFGQPASPSGSAGGGGATTGSYGVQFSVSSQQRCDGLWFYSLPGYSGALPDTIALYDTSGNLVSASTASWSGAAGSGWIFAAFAAPPLLKASTGYKAVIHQPFSSPNWYQVDSTYWSSGAGSGGITSGVLSAPNNATAANGQDSSVTGTSIGYPTTSMTGANIWLDVQVSSPPANTLTVFQQQPVTVPATSDNGTYTMGMQFQLSSAGQANAVWFYSPPGSPELPETIAIYNQPFSSLVHSETPTWAPSTPGLGWTRAAFASPVPLNATTNYKVCILKNGGSNNWYAAFSHYWDTTGPGTGGLTNGALSAPNNASAVNGDPGGGGQDIFNVGATLTYPNTAFNASNYWVDVEASLSGTSVSVADEGAAVDALTVSVSVPFADAAGAVDTITLAAAVPVGDVAGAVDKISMSAQLPLGDVAGAADAIVLSVSTGLADAAGAVDSISASAALAVPDAAGAVDTLTVTQGTILPPVSDAAGAVDSIVTHNVVLSYDTYFTVEPMPSMWQAESAGPFWQARPASGRQGMTDAGQI